MQGNDDLCVWVQLVSNQINDQMNVKYPQCNVNGLLSGCHESSRLTSDCMKSTMSKNQPEPAPNCVPVF